MAWKCSVYSHMSPVVHGRCTHSRSHSPNTQYVVFCHSALFLFVKRKSPPRLDSTQPSISRFSLVSVKPYYVSRRPASDKTISSITLASGSAIVYNTISIFGNVNHTVFRFKICHPRNSSYTPSDTPTLFRLVRNKISPKSS